MLCDTLRGLFNHSTKDAELPTCRNSEKPDYRDIVWLFKLLSVIKLFLLLLLKYMKLVQENKLY